MPVQSTAVRGVVLSLMYGACALIPSQLLINGHEVSYFWPGSGLAVVLALHWGVWPLLGVFAINTLLFSRLDASVEVAVLSAIGLFLQASVSAWFFRGPLKGNVSLVTRFDLYKFLFAGVLVGPCIGASVGALVFANFDLMPWDRFHSTWLGWWFGEALGVLFVGPIFLSGTTPLLRAFRERTAEAVVVLSCQILVCAMVFYSAPDIPIVFRAFLSILPIPALYWSAIRLGIAHSSLLLLVLGAALSSGGRAGFGPLGIVDTESEIFILWIYGFIAGSTTLLLSAISHERDSALTAQREAEVRFQNLIECGPSVAYVLAHDDLMKMLYVSPQIEEVIGYTAEECRSRPGLIAKIMHPEDMSETFEVVRKAWQERAPMILEYRVMHRDGSVRWLRDEARFIPGGASLPDQWMGMLIDVTSHREIVEEYRKSDALLSGIWATSLQGLFVLDTQGQIRTANPAACRMMGFAREELSGAYYNTPEWQCETVDGHALQPEQYPYYMVMQTRSPLGGYVHAITKRNGERRILSIDGAPLYDAAGDLAGCYFVVEDITAAHAAELRLQTSERRLATIIASANDAIITADEQGLITLFNPSAEKIFGFRRQEVLGRPLHLLLTDINLGEQGEDAQELTGKARRASGEAFPVEVSFSRAEVAGGKIQTVILRDISERIRAEEQRMSLEEQLRQAQKIEAVGQLAGGVAHDFNNLLQVMQGYTRLAMDELESPELRRAHLESVCNAVEKAASLTAQLLAFGRRQSLEKVDCDLNLLVQDHLKMVRRLIGEHISVEFIPGHAIGNARVDRSQIEQVVLNLCLNARDAMPNGGTLIIELGNVLIDDAYRENHTWARNGRYVLLTVTDNGMGMDADTQGRIYEPFFTTKPQGQGTGLGLSVVHGIVQQHGGLIHVYSEPGRGTSFKIYLPIVERSANAVGKPVPRPVLSGRGTVLLAEDEPGVREIAIKLLQRAGYEVLAAENGAVAVELFRRHADTLNLVVLDVVMPVMGGFEAYETMRSIREGIPCIFSSGYSGSALSSGGELPQGGHFLHKPYSFEQLVAKIADVINQDAST